MDIREKVERLLKWAEGEKAPPYLIELAITRSCNLRCMFCSQRLPISEKEVVLPQKKLIEIIHEAAKMGVKEISIAGGGEPFCRPKTTLEIMKVARSYNISGGITTNGTLFTDCMIKKIVEIGWDCIIFSIDSPTPSNHNLLRCDKTAFQKSINAIERFQYWKKRLNKLSPSIRINTVLCNVNYNEINQLIELAYNLGAFNITFIPLLINTSESKNLKLSENQIVELQENIKQAKNLEEMYNLTTNLNDFVDSRLISKTTDMDDVILSDIETDSNATKCHLLDSMGFAFVPCFSPWLSLVIHSSGHINPCIYENPVSYIGNRSLEDVWYNDEHINSIRSCMLAKKLPKMCSTCCAPRVAENREIRKDVMKRISK